MSEEMAVTDTGSGEEAKLNGDEAAAASATGATEASVEPTTQTPQDPAEGSTSQPTGKTFSNLTYNYLFSNHFTTLVA